MLREHWLATLPAYRQPHGFVLCSSAGTPLDGRNVAQRGLAPALRAAGVDGEGRPRFRWHDMRHCFASMQIEQGEDVVWLSEQLGHANPAITLKVYSHLYRQAEHAVRTRDRQEAAFGNLLETAGGNVRESGLGEPGAKVAQLRGIRDQPRWDGALGFKASVGDPEQEPM